jgi:Queuosine biosynthesis protein QueC
MTKISNDEEIPLRVNVLEAGSHARAGWSNCYIGEHLQFSPESLASYFFAGWETVIFDALLLVAAVEFCDRIKRRPALKWMRNMELRIPVHEPSSWRDKEVSTSLNDALQLLTGDRWNIEFNRRKKAATPPQQGQFCLPPIQSPAIIPFSEGMDSRSVAGLLSKEHGDQLIRVRLGTKTEDRPRDSSGRRSPFTTVPYKVKRGEYRFPESSARSRGFKFALLSGLAAYLASASLVIVPESGQGALGPSLVPVGQGYEDYRNHPLFTSKISAFLKRLLRRDIRFEFPRLWNTKGETLREYVSATGMADWTNTRSCWQDNRRVSLDGHRRHCGVCAACMLRRLSVHTAGLSEPPETYVWEDLRVDSFDDGAATGFDKTIALRDYAIAGSLHLDHLAGLRRSRIHAPNLESCVDQVAAALGRPRLEVETGLNRLLSHHEDEWRSFIKSLGPNSFVSRWIEVAHDYAA